MAYRMRYAIYLDWVGPGSGPMSGQLATSVGVSGGGGAQSVAAFNGGTYNVNGIEFFGSVALAGNSAPQIVGTGTNGALANADIQALLTAGTLVQGGQNLVADIYSQWLLNGGNNPFQQRAVQFANPGAFGAG